MPLRQKIVALIIALSILILIIELVRKGRLREEYSVLWILTGISTLILALWYTPLRKITHLIGAAIPTSTLFFFALIFLMLLSLQFSVKISGLANQVKELAQKLALLEVQEPPDAETAAEEPKSGSQERPAQGD